MSEKAISVRNLSKRYTIRHQRAARYQTLREVIASKTRSAWRAIRTTKSRTEAEPQQATREEFWAIRNVTFDVEAGEVVGIIGRNGAGKSTLLKLLSRITEPTTGQITLSGRVASLLEVGTGFHPELTGRENIYLNGSVLGMKRAEIKAKFEEIVAFAEVERFLDTPVKRYSSGMYVRLAFAVAAHLEPEILIVDEVLAVGDAHFQRKCMGKIGQVAKGGRTVLFVSHNMGAIEQLCHKAILMDKGEISQSGGIKEVIAAYLTTSGKEASAKLSHVIRLANNVVLGEFSIQPGILTSGSALEFLVQLNFLSKQYVSEATIVLSTLQGHRVSLIDLRKAGFPFRVTGPRQKQIVGTIVSVPLVEGEYTLGFYLSCDDYCGYVPDLLKLTVTSGKRPDDIIPFPPSVRGDLELSFRSSVLDIDATKHQLTQTPTH